MKRVLFYLILSVVATGYAMSCLSPFIHPRHSWLVYFAGLGFPVVASFFVILVVILVIKTKRYGWFLTLIPGMIFGLNYLSLGPHGDSTDDGILVYSLNAFSGQKFTSDNADYLAWIDFMDSTHNEADIFFLQEYPDRPDAHQWSKTMSHSHNNRASHLNILSQDRQLNTGELKDESGLRYAVYSDVWMGGDTIRCYTFHLQSNYLTQILDSVQGGGWSTELIQEQGALWSRMYQAAQRRADQVKRLRWHIQASPYRVIAGGDLNETSQSFTYRQLKRQLKDASRYGEFGVHPTYRRTPGPIRIDYVFIDHDIDVLAYHVLPYEVSDHRMIQVQLGLD